MATTFQRLCAAERFLEPRQYTVQTDSGRAALCCPACSHVFDLPIGCAPDLGGKTALRVPCPAPRCGWTDYALLESHWEDE